MLHQACRKSACRHRNRSRRQSVVVSQVSWSRGKRAASVLPVDPTMKKKKPGGLGSCEKLMTPPDNCGVRGMRE